MGYRYLYHQPETLRYMASGRFSGQARYPPVGGSSKESDVYSLAMTSFSVCTLFCKPSYYLNYSSHREQVLTGVLPYRGDSDDIPNRIRGGERPSRPTDPSQNRWLQDPIWDVITTGWSHEPEKRCELSVMHDAFVTTSQQGVYSGDLNDQDDRNLTITKTPRKLKQGDSNVGKFSHESPLSSNFYKTQSQTSRGRLTKLTR